MRKLLSLVLVVCMLVSAFGTVTALGATASGGSSSGGSGGGSSAGDSYITVDWDLFSNDDVCTNGKFYPGDLVLEGYVSGIDSVCDVYAVIAQYDNDGAMVKMDMCKNTVSYSEGDIYAELAEVDAVGKVKCMLLRADNFKPLCPSKVYTAEIENVVDVAVDMLMASSLKRNEISAIEYFDGYDAAKPDKLYVSADPRITVNGVEIPEGDEYEFPYMDYRAQVRFTDTDIDGYFDDVALTLYEYAVADEVVNNSTIKIADGRSVLLPAKTNFYDVEGKAITVSDIKSGDVIAMVVGELANSSCLPVSATECTDKLTIYNLGDSRITGTISGWDQTMMLLYIDGVEYRYSFSPWITTEDFSDLTATGNPLGIPGDFYLDMNGCIIGYKAFPYTPDNVGFIIQTHLNTSSGFTKQYQIQMLTKDGVVVFNVDSTCEIDGNDYNVENSYYGQGVQSDVLGVNGLNVKFDKNSHNIYDRLVEYELNNDGEIDTISFIKNMSATYTEIPFGAKYAKAEKLLGGHDLSEDICIFNMTIADSRDATVEDISVLADENTYYGMLADMNTDGKMDVFVVTEGKFSSGEDVPEEEPEYKTLTINANMFVDGALYKAVSGVDEFGNPIILYNWNTELDYYERRDALRTTKLYIDKNPLVRINGITVNNVSDLCDNYFINRNSIITFTENDNDKYYDVIDIQVVYYAIVESVLVDKSRITFADGSKMVFDFEDIEQESYFYNADGDEISFEDIEEGDVLVIEIGELDSYTQRPLSYNIFQTKATIYDLGKSCVTGTVTGWSHDATDNSGILYIDGKEYDYDVDIPWVTYSDYADLVANGDPLDINGVFYLGLYGEIIGFEASPYTHENTGFIIQTYFDTHTGFTNQYQVMVFTVDKGFVTYNVDTTCEINVDANLANNTLDYTYVTENPTANEGLQSDVFGMYRLDEKYDKNVHNTIDRLVKYELNKNGEIDKIEFAVKLPASKYYSVYGEYKPTTNKLGSRALSENLCIFNLTAYDSRNATIEDTSALIEESLYEGYVFDMDRNNKMDILIVTYGELVSREDEPEDETTPEYKEGLILQTYFNTSGFTNQYQIKILTDDEGIVTYNVDTICEINVDAIDGNSTLDYQYVAENPTGIEGLQSTVLGANDLNVKFNKFLHNADDRFVEFGINKNGEIDKIYFVKNMETANCLTVPYNSKYAAATGMLGGYSLSENIRIFNAVMSDCWNATSEDISVLINGNSYDGVLIDMDRDDSMDFFVVLYGQLLIPEEPDDEPAVDSGVGLIIQTYFNTSGFTNQYQIKILTDDEGIVTYNVDTICEINVDAIDGNSTLDYQYVADNPTGIEGLQSAVLGANNLSTKFNKNIHNVADRFVEYEINKNGEIDKIYFLNNMPEVASYAITPYSEFSPTTGKLGDKMLESDVLIFDVKSSDINEVKVSDISELVNRGTYAGHVFDLNKDKKMDIFVMTDGAASFDPEANLIVVDSATRIKYDDEDAIMIKYFTEGVNEICEAVFTEDSKNYLARSVQAYKSLAKGSVLVANVSKEGFVSEYAVIANVNAGGYSALSGSLNALTKSIYGVNEVGNSKQDKTEFVYGYISDIKGKTLTLGGTVANDFTDGRDFVIDARVAQYTYSTEGIKPRIVVGDYASKGVDSYYDGQANLVLLKLYDDEVTDIISFSERVYTDTPGIIAQTHYTGPGLDLN